MAVSTIKSASVANYYSDTTDYQGVYTNEEAAQKVIDRLPAGAKPWIVQYICSPNFILVVQKYYSDRYASAICFSYALGRPKYMRKFNGTWQSWVDL